MIVQQIGYLKFDQVQQLFDDGIVFSLYTTHKDTIILVKEPDVDDSKIHLYYPKQDRLPYKVLEGKKIVNGTKLFNSTVDDFTSIDISKWNNGEQIMAYEEYDQ